MITQEIFAKVYQLAERGDIRFFARNTAKELTLPRNATQSALNRFFKDVAGYHFKTSEACEAFVDAVYDDRIIDFRICLDDAVPHYREGLYHERDDLEYCRVPDDLMQMVHQTA